MDELSACLRGCVPKTANEDSSGIQFTSVAAEQLVSLCALSILMCLNSMDNTEDNWSKLQVDVSYRCWGVLVHTGRKGGADTGKTVKVYFNYTHPFYDTQQTTP